MYSPAVFVSRHSRFRGSYVVEGLRSIGEKDVIFHQGLHNVSLHQEAPLYVDCISVVIRCATHSNSKTVFP